MHCYAMLGGETLYPIHVAAREGDPEILLFGFKTSGVLL